MELTKEKLTQLLEKEIKVLYKPDSEDFTCEVHEESYSEENAYMEVEFDGDLWSFDFNIYHTWYCVHSGGDGWNDPSYYYAENEETEIELNSIYDEEGDEVKFNNEVEELVIKFIENNLF